jgi:predicted RNA binding protein YcfA (HicA-like mRNA interferase family)
MTGRLPAVTARRLIRALERGGFVLVRVTGSHHLYEHPARPERIVPVPLHSGDLKRGVLKTIIKQAGLTEAELIALL